MGGGGGVIWRPLPHRPNRPPQPPKTTKKFPLGRNDILNRAKNEMPILSTPTFVCPHYPPPRSRRPNTMHNPGAEAQRFHPKCHGVGGGLQPPLAAAHINPCASSLNGATINTGMRSHLASHPWRWGADKRWQVIPTGGPPRPAGVAWTSRSLGAARAITRQHEGEHVRVAAPRAHRVRTVAIISGQTPVHHPKMHPPKQPIEPQKT